MAEDRIGHELSLAMSLYPHLSTQRISELMEIGATNQQLKKADLKAKETLDSQMLQNRLSPQRLTVMVIGTSGSGKSATANMFLGEKKFEAGCSAQPITQDFRLEANSLGLTVVDTPGSWNTQLPVNHGPVDFYVIVINIASPRFKRSELQRLRNLQGPDHKGILSSGRCMAVLTHADTTLRDVSLEQYLTQIQGDPLHEFLQKDMKGRMVAVNNNGCTSYEREETQKGLVLAIAQAMSVALVQKDAEKKTLLGKIKDSLLRHLPAMPQSIRKILDNSELDPATQQEYRSILHFKSEDHKDNYSFI